MNPGPCDNGKWNILRGAQSLIYYCQARFQRHILLMLLEDVIDIAEPVNTERVTLFDEAGGLP